MKPLLFLKADSVVAIGFAFGTIGGFVATALITLSGLGASVFRTSHNAHFTTHLSSNQPSSLSICLFPVIFAIALSAIA